MRPFFAQVVVKYFIVQTKKMQSLSLEGNYLAVIFANYISKVCTIKNNTNLNSMFCLIKSSKNDFIFFPAFYLIIWLMTSANFFQNIATLKKWQLVFFWGVKTYFGEMSLKQSIFRHEIFYLYQYCPCNSYCPH